MSLKGTFFFEQGVPHLHFALGPANYEIIPEQLVVTIKAVGAGNRETGFWRGGYSMRFNLWSPH